MSYYNQLPFSREKTCHRHDAQVMMQLAIPHHHHSSTSHTQVKVTIHTTRIDDTQFEFSLFFLYLDRRVVGSFMTMTSVTSPNLLKYSLKPSALVCQLRPPINIFLEKEKNRHLLFKKIHTIKSRQVDNISTKSFYKLSIIIDLF